MFQIRENYYKASIKLVQKSQKDMGPTVTKTTKAQEVYLRNNSEIYTEDEIEKIRYFLGAFLYKFQLANYSLEQLWTIRDAKVEQNLFDIVRNSIDSLELTNDEVFLQSHVLEQFLFQSRACLDFFMLYLAHFLRTGHEGSMSQDKFYKRLKGSHPDLSDKATRIESYFNTKIFGPENEVNIISPTNWGRLLKSLRDKIAHKDKIKISKNSDDRIMNDILLDFPTLKDLTYDRFCQAMENGMWYMITDLFPILYDLKWQAGPYREGMFESESDSAGKSG